MKKTASLAAKILAVVLVFTMILPAGAKTYNFVEDSPIIVDGVVQERSTSFDSAHKRVTVGGITYEMWSSITQDSPTEYRGSTWVTTVNYENVPIKYMGTQSILYYPNTNGKAYYTSAMLYNTTEFYFQWTATPAITVGSEGVYCGGRVALRDSSGEHTYNTPNTVEFYPNARGFAASDDISEELNELAAALDENGQYPVTASGKTYGSGMLAQVVGHEPDLILAEGIGGVTGYIRVSDISPNVNTPEEAAAYMDELAANTQGYRAIPLYDLEENIIGSFHVDIPDFSEEIPVGIQKIIEQIEARKNWPRNSKGEFYGSFQNELEAKAIGIELDLIGAIGTEFQPGYIRLSDDPGFAMHAQLDTSDDEAVLEYMSFLKSLPEIYFIPLYDVEGNVIGKFRMGGSVNQTLSDEEISAQINRK